MNLENGIYLRRYVLNGVSHYSTRFVKDGVVYTNYPDGTTMSPISLTNFDAFHWERIGDLPVISTTEPSEIGYPVKARLSGSGVSEILFIRTYGANTIRWFSKSGMGYNWDQLINPRNLTDNELFQENIWTGEKR